ncbi:MAG: T9SS type A sorting domain-containing protein [Chitinophagales bacterium]|nr:T9SS type A sorting domain-containing protein [Chitinophagales bacterium]
MKKLLFTFLIIPSILIQAQEPTLIKDIIPGSGQPSILSLTAAETQVFFVADDYDGMSGSEVWRTDGTEEGTYLTKDINPGALHGITYFPGIFVVNDIAFFIANDGDTGNELWKSDGTEAGTQLVKDIDPGYDGGLEGGAAAGYYDPCFTVLGDILYFSADDGTHSYELWRSDGTEAGTYMVKDLVAGDGNSRMDYIEAAGDRVYFSAYNNDYEFCLWMTDGTEAGTVILKEDLWINSYNDQLGTKSFIEYDGYVYFAAGPDNYDRELWRTDGTEAGTELFFEFDDDEFEDGFPAGLEVFKDKLIFWTAEFDNKFFVSDGTVAGTNVLMNSEGNELNLGEYDTYLVTEDKLYFPASEEGINNGLWVTDLTNEGTFLLTEQSFFHFNDLIHGAAAIGNNIVFESFDYDNACWALYQSNGTVEGTELSIPCSVTYNPHDMVTLDGKVIMIAEDAAGEYGAELWLYEPTFAPVAIDGVAENNNINIYPNPAADYIQISNIEQGIMNKEVFIQNMEGRIMKAIPFSNEINISDLSSGIYFIKIGNSVQKFMKE